jgi:hypothetical protein
MLNLKAPGRDQIVNFWLKQLIQTQFLATLFNHQGLFTVVQAVLSKWLVVCTTAIHLHIY